MTEFYLFIAVFENSNRAVPTARRPNTKEITAHSLAGAMRPGFLQQVLVGAWSGPTAVGFAI